MYSGLVLSNTFEIRLVSNTTTPKNTSLPSIPSRNDISSHNLHPPAIPMLPIDQLSVEVAPVVRPHIHNIMSYGSSNGPHGKGRRAVNSGSSAAAIMGAIFGSFVLVTLAGYGLATYKK